MEKIKLEMPELEVESFEISKPKQEKGKNGCSIILLETDFDTCIGFPCNSNELEC